jgi:transposase
METIDARKHTQEVQEQLRRQIVKLRKQGRSNQDIAEIVGVSEPHASRVWHRWLTEGEAAIRKGQRGRRHGEKRSLTAQQESQIQRLLVDKTPDQLKLDFALWTREAVRLLIQQLFDFEMPIRTVGEYLNRWGFTPQKPIKRAYEQKPQAVQKWLVEAYPAIAARAKAHKAEIHWGDETGIQNTAYRQRGFAPRGEPPTVRLNARRSSIGMISAITNGGKVRFMCYREAMNSKLLIRFMGRLVKDTKRKVFLILDNLPVHHGKNVRKWLESRTEQIEVFYLPAYCPELNPDEYLNHHLKGKIHSGLPARSENELETQTTSFMRTLQKRPLLVMNYFDHHKVVYAA